MKHKNTTVYKSAYTSAYTSALLVALLSTVASTGHAATVDLSFNQLLATASTTGFANPSLDLKISDTAVANQLTFTVTATGLVGTETLDGIALNLSTAQAAGLTAVTISGQTPLLQSPKTFSLVPTGTSPGGTSAFSPNQNLQPGSNVGGNFDFYMKFPAGNLSATNVNTDTFTLTFTESGTATVTAANFLNKSASNGVSAGGYYAEAALSNSGAGGVAASGLSYVAAVPVPEPETLPLLLSGMGLMGLLALRKKRAE